MEWVHRSAQARQRVYLLLSFPLLAAFGLLATATVAEPTDTAVSAAHPRLQPEASPGDAASRPESARKLAMAGEDPPPKKARSSSNKQKQRAQNNKRKQEALARQEADTREAAERKQITEARIQELLAEAQRDYVEGRVLAPARSNAADRYQQVLAMDPTQLDALAGAKRIVAILAAEAERTAAAGDKGRTQQYIARIRALQPDDAALLELDARFKALNESPVVLSQRQQERYSRSAQSIQRAYDYLNQQTLDMQAIDQAIDEYDRAASQVAMAPGLPMLKDRILVAFPAATKAELARDNSKRALRVVQMARSRGWLTPELELLERSAKESSAVK